MYVASIEKVAWNIDEELCSIWYIAVLLVDKWWY